MACDMPFVDAHTTIRDTSVPLLESAQAYLRSLLIRHGRWAQALRRHFG